MAAADHVQEIRRALSDPHRVCERLGIAKGGKRQSNGLLVRCPHHAERDGSCSVTRASDGTIRCRCFACGWSGDVLTLIAEVHGRSLETEFREVLALGAEMAGMWEAVEELRGSPVPPEHRHATPPPTADEPPPPPVEYPPIGEVKALWEAAKPSSADADADEALVGRGLDPKLVDELRLARVVAPDAPLPGWARFRGRPWTETGHRLLLRVFDATGQLRSVRAWKLTSADGPKRLPPAGHLTAGLVLANGGGFAVLTGGTVDELVIHEGEPDFVSGSLHWRLPAIGIISGSWTPELAERIAAGAKRVIIRTHNDPAGDKYAEPMIEALKGKVEIWRRAGGPKDDNDLLVAGKLPANPKDDSVCLFNRDGTEPARILSVKQTMQAARNASRVARSTKACTTGLKELDDATGGLRAGFSWLFMAETSWGKSSFLVMLVDENIKRGKKCLIVTAEDDEEVYGARLLTRRAKVRAKALRSGHTTSEEEEAMERAIEAAESLPVYLDARGKTVEWVCQQVERLIDEHDIDIVAFDYLQEMPSATPHKNENVDQEIRARMLRHCVKGKRRCSVILSQITVDGRKEHPDKYSIRGSKSVANGAEVIVCGSTATSDIEVKNMKGDVVNVIRTGRKFLKLDKNKTGPKPVFVELNWDQDTASFLTNLDEPEPDFGGFDDATPDTFGGY